MGITAKISGFFDAVVMAIRKMAIIKGEYRNINRKKSLYNKVVLTEKQKAEIREFYCQHYGKNISNRWHRLYQSYTGTYRVDYLPEILFSAKLEPALNDIKKAAFLEDKNLLYRIFTNSTDIHIPKTYASCIGGIYQGVEGAVLSYSQMVEELKNIGDCVVKKTVNTSSGRDVMLCHFCNGFDTKTQTPIIDILRMFGKNFIVQEKVCQLPALAALNATSINTFRVMSYICDDKVKLCPLALRLGRSNADRDNIHYGGICVGVCQDGALRERAFSEYGEAFTAHPDSGIVFAGYRIPEVCILADAAKQLHSHMPYLGIISWDFTIDEAGKATLIEMNTYGQSAWFPQMVNGEPLFGDDTPKMLSLIRK